MPFFSGRARYGRYLYRVAQGLFSALAGLADGLFTEPMAGSVALIVTFCHSAVAQATVPQFQFSQLIHYFARHT